MSTIPDNSRLSPSPISTVRLRMSGVCKAFGATVALDSVDLEVQSGEVHGLVGENGAGKSTLMMALSGAHRIDAGHIWVDGRPYSPASPEEGRREGVAMIYQELSLAPHLSIMENIVLGAEPTAGPFVRWRRVREIAEGALAKVGLSQLDPETQVRFLSTAQQQLVEIARSVAFGARILVFDEPTSSLAKQDIERLFELIRDLREQDYAIVYISHYLEEIQALTDRYTVLRDGRSVGTGETAGAAMTDIVSMMVGRDVTELYPRSRRHPGEVVMSLDCLTGNATSGTASLELHRGEVLGIAGVVGAGRTELMRAIFGLDRVRSGKITVLEHAGPLPPSRRWTQGVGMLSEDRKREGLALGMSIADNVMLPKMPPFLTLSHQRASIKPWMRRLNLKCASVSDPAESLSGGNQQKVAFARLLHADVDVLLLDEPTRGIDVGSKAQIYRLIDALARGNDKDSIPGKALLMISSYLPELLGVCDRIAVMRKGVLGKARPVEDVDEHTIMLEATGAEEML